MEGKSSIRGERAGAVRGPQHFRVLERDLGGGRSQKREKQQHTPGAWTTRRDSRLSYAVKSIYAQSSLVVRVIL
jgi:hypothetical protein